MTEEPKNQKTPYVPWGTYINYINSLTEGPLPSAIDRSLMTSMSGGVQSILLIALRSTGMIDEAGVPTARLAEYQAADEEKRKELIAHGLRDAFPFLFNGSIDLVTTTPGKFDERLRVDGALSGSTLNKGANFFLSGAEYAEIQLGIHLKKRKPANRKPPKLRKPRESKPKDQDGAVKPPLASTDLTSEKALEYRLVDLMSEAAGDQEVMTSIINVITFLKTREASK